MAKLKLDAEFALHEFSVKYRAGLAKKYPLPADFMGQIRGIVRDQYTQEQQTIRGPAIEAPKIDAPKIEGPAIEGPPIKGPKIEGPKIGPPRMSKQPGLEPDI